MKEKNVSIQVIRICSMFAIILCHLVQELNNATIAKTGQFFNVGVYIFLFLSGWLYGKKKISNAKEWILGRIRKVLLPMWMFMPFLFLMHTLQGTMKWKYIPIFLMDAQYWFEGLIGGAHLWFVSIIFLCYLIVPFLQKANKVWDVIVPTLIVGGGTVLFEPYIRNGGSLCDSLYNRVYF